MSTSDFVKTYVELFAGTPDCYAISRDWTTPEGEEKRAYLPSNYSKDKPSVRDMIERFTTEIGSAFYGEEAARAHLMGQHFLGVYPIHADSTVKFFALDFDKDEPVARKEAARQQRIFRAEAGIETYIERSRSGNGYHLWGFLEEPHNAGELRFALSPYIEDTDTYDRMFPNQDGNTATKPYGNLIALPLYGPNVKEGKGAFIHTSEDGEATAIEDQKDFLRKVKRVPRQVLQDLFDARTERYEPDFGGKIRTGDPEGLPGIYKVVHKILGCQWLRWCYENPDEVDEPTWYVMACQFAQLEGGREMFHEFSQQYNGYSVTETDDKFDQAMEVNAPHRCDYIRDNCKGPACDCDVRFAAYGVNHPYDLAKVPFSDMIETLKLEQDADTAAEGLGRAIESLRFKLKNPNFTVGIPYGIPDIDQHTELRDNDLIVVAARPGRGKTAFMIDIAFRVASTGVPVYIVSMEMDRDQLWQRMLARIAKVNGTRLAHGTLTKSEIKRALSVKRIMDELPIIVEDTTYEAGEVVNKISEMIAQHGKGVVMIDYLQMATNLPQETDYQKNSRVPRQYKLLAKAMHVPVLVLAQMNREGEDLTEDSETLDSVLEGSGKIEQYADVIMMILGLRRPGIVRRTIIIHKERHREAGHRIKLDFNQPIMQFAAEGKWTMMAQAANQMTGMSGSATPTTISGPGFFSP